MNKCTTCDKYVQDPLIRCSECLGIPYTTKEIKKKMNQLRRIRGAVCQN